MKGKAVFITGGNEGIGLATAIAFARQGANVAIFGRREDKNAQAKTQIEAAGVKCMTIKGDVTRENEVSSAIDRVIEEFGGLHFAFNNAGLTGTGVPFAQQTLEDYEHLIGINLTGVWLSMKYELPAIVASGGGAIVNTGSTCSLVGVPMVATYCASKHAVVGLTKAVALEYARQGVRINAICPGTTAATGIHAAMTRDTPEVVAAVTGMVPMGRMANPEEIAGGVLYLCSDTASYVTGQTLVVDGGMVAA